MFEYTPAKVGLRPKKEDIEIGIMFNEKHLPPEYMFAIYGALRARPKISWDTLHPERRLAKIASELSLVVACDKLDERIDARMPGFERPEQCLKYVDVFLQRKEFDDPIGYLFSEAGEMIARNRYVEGYLRAPTALELFSASGETTEEDRRVKKNSIEFFLEKPFLTSFLGAQFTRSHEISCIGEYTELCRDKSGSMLALVGMIHIPHMAQKDIDALKTAGIGMQYLDDVRDIVPDTNDGSSNGVLILQSDGYTIDDARTHVLNEAVRFCETAKNMGGLKPGVSECLSQVYELVRFDAEKLLHPGSAAMLVGVPASPAGLQKAQRVYADD